MSSFDPNYFDEILNGGEINNEFVVDEEEAIARPYNRSGGSFNNVGGAMSHAPTRPSNPMTASQGSSYTASHTTITSLTSPNPEYGTSSGLPAPQEREPVPQGYNVGDLDFITGGDQPPIDEEILNPTTLDRDMQRLLAERSLQMSVPRQGPLIGLPGHNTPAASSTLEELRMELRFLNAVLLEPVAESLLNEDEMEQILSQLRHGRTVIEKKRRNGHRISKPPSTRRNGKAGNCKKKFRCIRCGTEFGTTGALQRHVEDQHHPCVNIGCPQPGCGEISRRRDKARDHCLIRHMWRPTNAELELYTTHLECPPHCSICFLVVNDWRSFYKCFISHCGIDNIGQYDGPSFDDDPGNGAGPASGNGSNFPDMGMGGAGMSADKGHNNYGGPSNQHWDSCFQKPNWGQNAYQYASGMQRSSSDGDNMVPPQPDAYHDTNQKRRASAQDNPGLPRDFPQLGLPQKRPLKRPKKAGAEPQEDGPCPICGHKTNDCKICQKRPMSSERCHACASNTTMAQTGVLNSQVGRYAAPSQGSVNSHPVITPQQLRYLQNLQVQMAFGNISSQAPRHHVSYGHSIGRPQGAPRGSNDFTNMVVSTYVPDLSEDEMLPTGSESSNASFGGTWLSCLPIRVSLPREMVKVSQEAKALGSGAPGATDQMISQTISETESPINLPVAKLEAISPKLCRCPCRTKTAGPIYSSNSRVELIPGKLLDMTLTILPEDRVGHPLRTRIRVVVKLLKLRSSVVRSGNKKKNKEDAKAIELVLKTSLDGSAHTAPVTIKQEEPIAVDESDISESEDDGTFSDAESVTSSVAEASSVSELALVPFKRANSDILFPDEPDEDHYDTSDLFSDVHFPDDDSEDTAQPEPNPDDIIDEIQSLSLADPNSDYEIEETELEISMDLDFQTCLDSLSSWTDGLADIEQSGHTITDPARVFEYFFRYIIYVIFALSKSRIEAAGR
ncbi:uncharacterized protein N7484_007416 [Penicillium longicatenatum]|uniref:uncharacterized protein n=1 Tax=Penicillium longicatenatum TaxID=1561947 RepID=UPI002549C139|nr:uncharacterized protein N7484_007416 [Penicillium longicatenatum]KAJ5639554.1 hypothetical protein N7484_007416 [Penicillium longicatenatum]